jgi:hypothetical protein
MGVMAAAILITLWWAKRGRVPYVRRIAGVTAIEEAVGRATELGRPVVYAMGNPDIRDIKTHVSLAVLAHVARLAARMQTQLIVLVHQANVYPVAEQVVRQAYMEQGRSYLFNPAEQIRFLSTTSEVFAMGVARTIEETRAGCAIFYGPFDFTSLLMAEPGARMGVYQIASEPSLWQVPFFVCTCAHTIMGEEFFAAGAYVSPDPTMKASLFAQDIIKVIFAALIVVGTILALLPFGPAKLVVKFLQDYP